MNKITFERAIMIFRKDFDNRTVYRFGIGKKRQDGTYENGYIDCQFKKDVELANQTKIMPTEAWLTFYKSKDGKTVPYVFINEFEEEMIDADIDEVLSEDDNFDLDDLDNEFLDE